MLCNLLQYDIEIVALDENTEPYQQMEHLKEQGYEMVLCDMVGTSIARELGMNFILITSGRESIEAALDQAVRFSKIFSITRQQSQVLKAAVIQSREALFIYTKDGQPYFSSMERSPATAAFFNQVEQNLTSFLSDSRFRAGKPGREFCLHHVFQTRYYQRHCLCIYLPSDAGCTASGR